MSHGGDHERAGHGAAAGGVMMMSAGRVRGGAADAARCRGVIIFFFFLLFCGMRRSGHTWHVSRDAGCVWRCRVYARSYSGNGSCSWSAGNGWSS